MSTITTDESVVLVKPDAAVPGFQVDAADPIVYSVPLDSVRVSR